MENIKEYHFITTSQNSLKLNPGLDKTAVISFPKQDKDLNKSSGLKCSYKNKFLPCYLQSDH